MREIKFRAWDKNRRKMLDVYRLSWNLSGQPEGLDGWNEKRGYPAYAEDITLMQFTGLKDKNGKEIYEGDVFNCLYERDGHNDHRYVVEYSVDSASFLIRRTGNTCPQIQVRQTTSDHAGWRGEVIGNIYENPELLKP